MNSTTFRTLQPKEREAEQPTPKATNAPVISESKVEVPYTEYENDKGVPYLVDHYELGSYWNDRNNGFIEEIATIEDYLKNQAIKGEIDNSLKGVKNRLKEIEKVVGVKNESRVVVKLGMLSEYIKFLAKTDDIKKNIIRYDYR